MKKIIGALALWLGLNIPVLAAEPLNIRIGVAEIGVGNREFGTQGSGAIAHAEGYFDRAFADRPDIKITWHFFKGAGPAVNEALVNKQLDFALQGDLPAIIARANGLKTKLLAASGVRNNIYLAVGPNSGIAGIKDLRGRKVSQFRGTNLQLAADRVLAANGLKESDIKFLSMDFTTALAAIASGDVEAVFGQADLRELEKQGLAKIVYTTKGDDPGFTRHSHLLVTEEFERAHPDLTAQVVKTIVRAAAWGSDESHRQEVFAVWAKSGRPLASFAYDFEGQSLKYRLSPLLDPFIIQAYADKIRQAKEHKLLRGDTSVDGWFESKYLTAAIKELGLEGYWQPLDAQGRAVVH